MDNGALTLMGYSLSSLTGRPQRPADHEALSIVAEYAKSYTRGNGFDPVTGNPNDALAAVILTATARLIANPSQLAGRSIGGLQLNYRPWQGFTVGEQLVLNRYRQRTA